MNAKIMGLILACGLATAVSAFAGASSNVTVTYDHPEKFADIKDAFIPTEKGQHDILAALTQFIADRAGSYLGQGQHLEIKFTDIDLAGDFEPQLGTRFNGVRVMREIYPPRLKFEFKLTGPDGRVLKEGQRRLTDPSYQQRILRPGDDGMLRYEKDLLVDWMRHDLGSAKSAGG